MFIRYPERHRGQRRGGRGRRARARGLHVRLRERHADRRRARRWSRSSSATSPTGTRVRLSHAFADPAVRDHHVQGWRYQLSLFAQRGRQRGPRRRRSGRRSLVRRLVRARCRDARRGRRRWSSPAIAMRDQFSAIEGLPDLIEHLAAVHRFMPGMTIDPGRRRPAVSGMAIADWIAPRCRRSGTEPRHQRVHPDARRPDRECDGVLEAGRIAVRGFAVRRSGGSRRDPEATGRQIPRLVTCECTGFSPRRRDPDREPRPRLLSPHFERDQLLRGA